MRIAIALAFVLAAVSAPALADEHTVRITNFAFEPAKLRVSVGDTVVFVNDDQAPHTATAKEGAFDTGRLNPGDKATVTISTRGSFDYFCQIHPAMEGELTTSSY